MSADDVRHFVDQVSTDMASLYDELAVVYAENHRIKAALRDWQSEHGPSFDAAQDRLAR